VATDQPVEGRHTSLGGERRILLRKVTSRARQCPRITRGLLRERDRLVEQLRLLRRCEPFAFVAGREPDEVGKGRRRRFVRVLLRDRPEPDDVGSGPVRRERVTRVRVVDIARREENLFTDRVDGFPPIAAALEAWRYVVRCLSKTQVACAKSLECAAVRCNHVRIDRFGGGDEPRIILA